MADFLSCSVNAQFTLCGGETCLPWAPAGA